MNRFAVTALGALALTAAANAAVITQWNFNGPATDMIPGGTGAPTPSTGAGTASLLGTTGAFNSGTSDGGSSDPVTTTPNNYSWNTSSYPTQGTGNNSEGVQFMVSTVGLTDDFTVMFDVRGSGTASRFIRLMYTTDGTNFTDAGLTNNGVYEINGTTSFNNRNQFWFGGIAGVANNANFGFRIVATFGPGGAYVPVSSANYATNGTLRYDMVTVFTPAPGAAALLGLAGLVSRRRRA